MNIGCGTIGVESRSRSDETSTRTEAHTRIHAHTRTLISTAC